MDAKIDRSVVQNGMRVQGSMPGVFNGLVVCNVFNSPILSMKERKLASNTIVGGVNSTNFDGRREWLVYW
jgi:hypothetical protein